MIVSTPPTAGGKMEPAIVGISGYVLGGKRHLGQVVCPTTVVNGR